MKILVTGGAGFIGSNFVHYWLAKHPLDKIVNLDALTYAANPESLQDLESNPNYQFVKGNILDWDLVDKLVSDCDLIVHFAAESHVDRSISDSAAFIQTNVEGTRVLLEAAKRHGLKRFHHVSTDEVFGALDFDSPKFSEITPYDPRSPYSASKAASDHLVRAYYHTYGLPVTISNCSNNYGPYQHPEKLIPHFITNLLNDQPVTIYGEGKNIRDWIYVDDHNRGLELIISQGKIGETYCLGGDSERDNLSLTKDILRLMGQSEDRIEYVADRLGHDLRYAIDFSKANRQLNFQPQVSWEEGLARTIKWYQDNPSWWRSLRS
ncbi:MAG: dTDP-glucose 4,6-dehydratase [Patescibacteria group bacterium]